MCLELDLRQANVTLLRFLSDISSLLNYYHVEIKGSPLSADCDCLYSPSVFLGCKIMLAYHIEVYLPKEYIYNLVSRYTFSKSLLAYCVCKCTFPKSILWNCSTGS
jgi:hypothetical protein